MKKLYGVLAIAVVVAGIVIVSILGANLGRSGSIASNTLMGEALISSDLEKTKEFQEYAGRITANGEAYYSRGNAQEVISGAGGDVVITPAMEVPILFTEGENLTGIPLQISFVDVDGSNKTFPTVCWKSFEGYRLTLVKGKLGSSNPLMLWGSDFVVCPYTKANGSPELLIIDLRVGSEGNSFGIGSLAEANGIELPIFANDLLYPVIDYPDTVFPMYYYSVEGSGNSGDESTYLLYYEDHEVKMEEMSLELGKRLGVDS